MKLTVIVPVYNERRTIRQILEKVRGVPLDKEIIIVDGGSTDGTRELLELESAQPGTRVIYEPKRRGRGRALMEGLGAATGDVVIFQDADLELDPMDYPALVAPLESGRCDVVFGSRFLRGRPTMTFLQYWGNRIINLAVNLLYGTRLTDVETCYQLFRREIVQGLEFHNQHFGFTVELAVELIKRGHKIVEVPIRYLPRSHQEGKKVYWGDGFVSLYVLTKYRFINSKVKKDSAVHKSDGL